MEIREYTAYNEAEVLGLYSAVGWTAYTGQPETLRNGFANSLLTLAAYGDGQLLGLLRAVGDGATIVFIQDILVLPERQRQGIGTALLQAALQRYRHVRQIQLAADDAPETAAFYRANGFQEMAERGCRGYIKFN